jgi:hypothetical protein
MICLHNIYRIILAEYGEEPGSFRAGKALLKNLKILLVFWQEHYLHKDKVNHTVFFITSERSSVLSCKRVNRGLNGRTAAPWRRAPSSLSPSGNGL